MQSLGRLSVCMIVITCTVRKKVICTMYKYSYWQLCENPRIVRALKTKIFSYRHFKFEIVVQIFQPMLLHVIIFFFFLQDEARLF